MSISNRMKSIPVLVNLCIDKIEHEELKGRLYHRYNGEAIPFHTIVEAMGKMEELYDSIRYPQASVQTRQFVGEKVLKPVDREAQVSSTEEILAQKGEIATFSIGVSSRMRASWQGEVYWVEQDEKQEFFSDMELLNALLEAINTKK